MRRLIVLSVGICLMMVASLSARPSPSEVTAYFPGTVAWSPGSAFVRIDLGACRLVNKVEWSTSKGAKFIGTADGHQLALYQLSKPATYNLYYMIRGGSCRGYRGQVQLTVKQIPPRKATTCKTPCQCGGYCGPRRIGPPW